MNNFKIIYKILRLLEKAMDYDEFDITSLNAKTFGISEARFNAILNMLVDDGYIVGIVYRPNTVGVKILSDVRISLKGLEYLEENSLMKKVSNIAKGIADICT